MAETDQTSEMEVSWLANEVRIYGSLTRPVGNGPFPAVLMVAGSGPTDRNWNSPLIQGTNGSGGLLAQALAQAGFLVLRYDKSASGPHVRENISRLMGKISMQSHVAELAGGVQLLADREDVEVQHLFALTNSEGCIHALNYQIQTKVHPFSGLVLTSAPARPIGSVGRAQIAAQLAAVPEGQKMLAAYDSAIADFTAGQPVNVPEDLPQGLRNAILGITNPANQPFARELWLMDVADLLKQVTRPVLIVLGKKDIQVDWQADGEIFDAIARNQRNVAVVYLENANHVLKFEPKPRKELNAAEVTASYSAADTTLDATAVNVIIRWLKERV